MNPYGLARPLLFALDPEAAHRLTLSALEALRAWGALGLATARAVHDPVTVMGLRFSNRVGLAAGLDKNAAHVDALGALGFGFIEVGTVTPRPQSGNPAPRLFRLPARQALINRLGFNNDGVDAFAANVERARWPQAEGHVLGLNIGKNAATPLEQAADDYAACLQRVYRHADYVTLNVSSPNTRNLRQLQDHAQLDALLARLNQVRAQLADRHGRRVPLLLKIAPDLDEAQLDAITDTLQRRDLDGVIATNTTVSREAVAGLPHADEVGGLSGAPVREASDQVIRSLRKRLPADYPIIGVGGILSAPDARAKIEAGATLVQLYTGLIYQGPKLVHECAAALAAQCAEAARSAQAG